MGGDLPGKKAKKSNVGPFAADDTERRHSVFESSRAMNLRSRLAVLATATATIAGIGIGIGAAPASAKVHRGVAGCFAWSWGDGWNSRTVYWHNRCSTRHKIAIKYWNRRYTKTYSTTVAGDGKGHEKLPASGIKSIKDKGRVW